MNLEAINVAAKILDEICSCCVGQRTTSNEHPTVVNGVTLDEMDC